MIAHAVPSLPAAGNRDAQALWWAARARQSGYDDVDTLRAHLELPPYRLAQIYRAAAKELHDRFEDLTVLPRSQRESLAKHLRLSSVHPAHAAHSGDAQTSKFLFALAAGDRVEAVLMRHRGGRTTACISSQAGCALRCSFCATGQGGFFRNLTSLEILDQAVYVARAARAEKRSLSNLVFMGMGEPFLNYDAVLDAVAMLNDPHGFNLGARRMTISTAGVVPGIERFTAEGIQVNLAISLHAPDDELRTQLMPINKKWPIAKLMAAARAYVAATRRKVFYEYLMLGEVNDRPEDARRLADLLGGPLHHVNLIPYNATAARYRQSEMTRMRRFQNVLHERGVPTTVRYTMGADIAAACGQLRIDQAAAAL
ncbi:MAG: 23S rRNA (adenine(2503)-C(2))-methyltransferase RlmN [Candidatus Eremiobacter antarcticus]|nr:23S rRNA (adenine(2503)-C(2))-methyltransferase RlmN [Candidatus Eremiobacteraeota bacterium]MBC5807786.1 23S rRNA (adenine(2503)-C(2))-methyltransferase RlmN [Candidatus Eremiobacteraeota bacterium]PZR60763.1 MAG: 23S rRNA (adenine(2503)-C(2))-methyltransferase RlmN [Candidatus Eremiobacter sp. RRmetagenome_bin22]